MKTGDKLPLQIDGVQVGLAQVREVRADKDEVDFEVPGLYVTMGLRQSVTSGPDREPDMQVIIDGTPVREQLEPVVEAKPEANSKPSEAAEAAVNPPAGTPPAAAPPDETPVETPPAEPSTPTGDEPPKPQ